MITNSGSTMRIAEHGVSVGFLTSDILPVLVEVCQVADESTVVEVVLVLSTTFINI